jgi:DNA invertase Pin-like site-specific DNA recombinase
MEIGYARVSTREQDLSGQLAELTTAGCAKVYREKASGARGDRAELAKVMKRLQPGDVLVVTRLDRLARSTRDLLNVLASVTERGAGLDLLVGDAAIQTLRGEHAESQLPCLGVYR